MNNFSIDCSAGSELSDGRPWTWLLKYEDRVESMPQSYSYSTPTYSTYVAA